MGPREGLDVWTKDVCPSVSKVRFPDLPASSLVTVLNELSGLQFSDEYELRILSSRPTVSAHCTGYCTLYWLVHTVLVSAHCTG